MEKLTTIDPNRIDTGRRNRTEAARLRKMIRLRKRGKTWTEVGDALGITRQAASQAVKKWLASQGLS